MANERDGAPKDSLRLGERSFVLVVVVTALLVGVGAALVIRNESERRERSIESTLGSAEAAARSADQVLADNLALLNLIATSPILSSVDPSSVQAVLNAIDVGSAGFTGGVSWIGPDGRVQAATGLEDGAPRLDLSRTPAVMAILDHGRDSFVSEGFIEEGIGPSVTLAVPARDEAGETVGVVTGSLSLDRVARHLTGFSFGGSDLVVLDRSNQIVVGGRGGARVASATINDAITELRERAPSTATAVTDPLGRADRLIAGAPSPNGDWLVIVSRSEDSVFGDDRRNLQLELAGLAVAALLAIGIAWRFSRRFGLLQRIADLAAAAEQEARERAVNLRLAMADVASSLSRHEAAEVAVSKGRSALGAKTAALSLREDESPGTMRLMAQQGAPTGAGDGWDRYPLSADTPGGAAILSGQPLFLDTADVTEQFPTVADAMSRFGCSSWASVPLRAEGEVFGVLVFGFEDEIATAPERQSEVISFATEVAGTMAWVHAREVEHEFALALQRNLLPASLPHRPDLTVEAEYLPANGVFDVGGDWYDVLERPDGGTMLVVGDVVGHGVAAIGAMGQLSSVCRAVADEASPAMLLDYLDRLARRVPSAVGATAVCVLIDADRTSATYTIAGHPRPLLVEGGEVTELNDGVSTPLGYSDEQRVEAVVRLARPSTLVLFTDGLIERRDATYSERVDILRRIAATSAPDVICARIVEELATDSESPDDTIVMVVHLPAGGDQAFVSSNHTDLDSASAITPQAPLT